MISIACPRRLSIIMHCVTKQRAIDRVHPTIRWNSKHIDFQKNRPFYLVRRIRSSPHDPHHLESRRKIQFSSTSNNFRRPKHIRESKINSSSWYCIFQHLARSERLSIRASMDQILLYCLPRLEYSRTKILPSALLTVSHTILTRKRLPFRQSTSRYAHSAHI